MSLVTIEEIRAAADRISGLVTRTPLLPCAWAERARPLWVKAESLQPVGVFKQRGASNAIAVLDADQRSRGVVTHSSGNHAQALAWAARAAGVAATVVMPDSAPAVKVQATRTLGAEVVIVPPAQRLSTALQVVEDTGAVLVPPYDDAAVIAGQGTLGAEIAEDLPDVEAVLVPVSGGGLVSGVAVAVKALCPHARVIGVEPELAGDLAAGFAAGERQTWPLEQTYQTVADGLRVSPVGELPWEHISAYVDDVVTVSEEAILAAMRRLALGSRLVAEPSGATAVAAYLEVPHRLPPGRTVAVLSGGNVDPALLASVLAG
ncbi:MAG TPA: threonine/serine dehydratase [Nocardioidaceae bacterium]|nr:threonine/serine dehydratase [Nocardioidaceae bacterium]